MRPTTVLVEGESDRVAVEALARRGRHDLATEQVTVVAMGGATSIGRLLSRHGPTGADDRVLTLCDQAEAAYVARALDRAGLGSAVSLHVCEADLEDELVRCLGTESVLDVIDAEGELASFGLLQRQPAQRDRALTDQLRRFFAGRSGHKITYARLLVEALPPGVAPPPLAALVAAMAEHP
ncbi:MAG: TOPRIM nucleotidyl transferase/hydrolase domain-containing protein [Janthinobacterium lividum]